MRGSSFWYQAEHMLQLSAVAAGAALGGAAASYFLDPELGCARRARLREELARRATTDLGQLNRASTRWARVGLGRLGAQLRPRAGRPDPGRTNNASRPQEGEATIIALRRTGS